MIKIAETKPEVSSPKEFAKEPTSIQSYILISEKNIFNPERKDFPITPLTPLEQSKPNVRPQIILYGVSIAQEYQSASIINSGRPLRKGERETLTIKLEEKIGDYKVSKILPDRITMESNGDSFEVLLYDPKNPKKRMEIKTEIKPPMVTSSQPTPVLPSVETPKPTLPQESAEKPREPVPQQIIPPPPAPSPRITFPPSSVRRGRRPVYPTPPPTQGVPTQ